MLIVAKQDDEKFAIWNTVTDEFVGVNLSKDDAVLEIMADRCCTREAALSRVEHPQPFSDIARLIDDGDCDNELHKIRIDYYFDAPFNAKVWMDGKPVRCSGYSVEQSLDHIPLVTLTIPCSDLKLNSIIRGE